MHCETKLSMCNLRSLLYRQRTPFALHLLFHAVTVSIAYMNAQHTLAHEAASPGTMQLATRQAGSAFAVHLYHPYRKA